MNTILLSLSFVVSGWGPSGCFPVGEPFAAEVGTRWQKVSDDYWALYRGNVQIAGYFPEHQPSYRTVADGKWGVWQEPPIKEEMIGAPVKNFGVIREKLCPKDCDDYTLNGKTISKIEMQARLSQPVAGQIPDDVGLLRLTVICPDKERDKVLADLNTHPLLASLKTKLVIQSYPPTDWSLRPGFVTTGRPTIYLQAPSGKVLHRQDEYRGPELLAQAVNEALRKQDPKYDGKSDPDLNRKSPLSPSGGGQFPWPILVLLAGLALLVFAKSAKAKVA